MQYTENYNLRKPDQEDFYDVEDFNDNAEIIDEELQRSRQQIFDHPNKDSVSLSTAAPVQHIISKVEAPVSFEMEGQQVLINLLGKDGNCENVTVFAKSTGVGTELNTDNKVFGTNSLKITLASTNNSVYLNRSLRLPAKYILISGYLKNGNLSGLGCRLYLDMVGDVGIKGSNYVTATTWQRVGFIVQPTDFDTATSIYLNINGNGATGEYFYVDGLMINEITADEYNNLTESELLAKYPYVDGAQMMMNPVVEIVGENLFDGEMEKGAYNGITGDKTDLAGAFRSRNNQTVKGGHTYKFSFNRVIGNELFIYEYDRNGKINGQNLYFNITGKTEQEFTVKDNTRFITFRNSGSEDFSNLQIMLQLGTSPIPYKSYKATKAIFPTTLAKIGTIADKLKYENGKAVKEGRIKKLVLDGSHSWTYNTNHVGYKRISILQGGLPLNIGVFKGIKYNGIQLTNYTDNYNSSDILWLDPVGFLSVTISNSDSGWGDSYTPTADEIKAYFNGWRMHGNAGPYEQYTSGTKRWSKILGYSENGSIVPRDETTVLPTASYEGYKSYQLFYVTANTEIEEIQPIGDVLQVQEGSNTVSVGTGRVYERANPVTRASAGEVGITDINMMANYEGGYSGAAISSKFKCKASDILRVCRDFVDDTTKWIIERNVANAYGTTRARIATASLDRQAQYFVEYELLHEEYDSQLFSMTTQYPSNLLTAQQETAKALANTEQRLTTFMAQQKRDYTTADLTLYVSPAGNDSNNGLTWGTAFRTIQRAIDSLPKRIDHTVNIEISSGTYDEALRVTGFYGGGSLNIRRINSSATVAIDRAVVVSNSIIVALNGLTYTRTTSEAIHIARCKYVTIVSCIITVQSDYAGLRSDNSFVYTELNTISNRSFAILSSSQGILHSHNNTGAGNTVALRADYGGTLTKGGTSQPSGTTAESVASGGVIR